MEPNAAAANNNDLEIQDNASYPKTIGAETDASVSVQLNDQVTFQVDSETKQELLLTGNVILSKKEFTLTLTTQAVILKRCVQGAEAKRASSNKDDQIFDWRDVIRAEVDPKARNENQHSQFCLHYIQRRHDGKLKRASLSLTSTERHAEKWINAVEKQCSQIQGRPKKLYVIVNPIGGKGEARQTYHKSVAPAFELAHIHTTVVLTERSKHALEIGEHTDFSRYDGIVIVGGDGLYQEVLQGLVLQTQRQAGVDINDPEAKLVRPDVVIGVIPGGTGNGISAWVNSVVDVETATLNIIRGEQHCGNLFTIFSQNKFLAVSGLVIGYGLFGDFIKRSDELRWMGRPRYAYCTLASIFNTKRKFDIDLSLLVPDESAQVHQGDSMTDRVCKWIKHDTQGRQYCGIMTFTAEWTDCGDNNVTPNYFGENIRLCCDLGEGNLKMFKFILTNMNGKHSKKPVPPNMDLIENVQGFKVKLCRSANETGENVRASRAKLRELEDILDVDGEVVMLQEPEFEARLHTSYIRMYGVLPIHLTAGR